jgi:glycosyltransferase involved in cell wall biosynthesis
MNVGILIPGFSANEQDWCIPVYLNLVRVLAQTNDVRVFALRYPPRRDEYSVYGARVFAIGGRYDTAGVDRWRLLMRTIRQIMRQHRARPFDVLHAIWADETGFAAWVAGRLVGVPVVVSVAGGELARLPGYGLQSGRISRWLVKQALTRPDIVIAPCQYAADLIAGAELHPRRLEIVPLGVDTALFSPSSAQCDADRLLAVGSLTQVKGHDRLLQALACLPGIGLVIAGEGQLLADLRALADSLGVLDRVTFRGPITHDALPGLYRSAALHVLTSRHEAFGMVVTEAAACGVPTVGFAYGVLNDFAAAGAGIAVEPGNIGMLASKIRVLLEDPGQRAVMGLRARELAETRYSVESMVKGIQNVYAKIAYRER